MLSQEKWRFTNLTCPYKKLTLKSRFYFTKWEKKSAYHICLKEVKNIYRSFFREFVLFTYTEKRLEFLSSNPISSISYTNLKPILQSLALNISAIIAIEIFQCNTSVGLIMEIFEIKHIVYWFYFITLG